jgi:GH15 family glucan-1,4-alpha-glucosidase
MMAWVALDRGIKSIESLGVEGPLGRWRALRKVIFDEVCEKGWSPEAGAFTQYYGSKNLDASLLMMPLVGFLPVSDERVSRTIAAIQRDLMRGGFVDRYSIGGEVDGVSGRDASFIPCTFWLADCLALCGRREEARAIFERLLAIRNDVGLLAEEYDSDRRRMVGNFPQAFSHVALIHSAMNLMSPDALPPRCR